MVLLKSVIEVAAHPMSDLLAEFSVDRSRIGIMAIRRDPGRRHASDRLRGSKECPGGSEIAMPTQHEIDQGTVSIDRAIQISPWLRTLM